MLHNRFIWQCPEGIMSIYLAGCSEVGIKGPEDEKSRTRWREAVMELIKPTVGHFMAPVLLRRMKLGAWPTFGQAKILEVDVHWERYDEAVAKLVVDTEPR